MNCESFRTLPASFGGIKYNAGFQRDDLRNMFKIRSPIKSGGEICSFGNVMSEEKNDNKVVLCYFI